MGNIYCGKYIYRLIFKCDIMGEWHEETINHVKWIVRERYSNLESIAFGTHGVVVLVFKLFAF